MYIPLRKPYIFTLIFLLFAGLILSVVLNSTQEANHTLMLGLVATLIATGICAIANLLYFVSSASLLQRLVAPGALVIVLFLILYKDSLFDLLFFLFFGIVNLGIGIYWYVSILRIKRESERGSQNSRE